MTPKYFAWWTLATAAPSKSAPGCHCSTRVPMFIIILGESSETCSLLDLTQNVGGHLRSLRYHHRIIGELFVGEKENG
eukprot:7257066-Alexandrium_andersonii.AAC.1